MHDLLHWTGIDTQQSYLYDFWSGIGTQLSPIVLVIVWYARHNCHKTGCLRLGKFPIEGSPLTVCRKHHPTLRNK